MLKASVVCTYKFRCSIACTHDMPEVQQLFQWSTNILQMTLVSLIWASSEVGVSHNQSVTNNLHLFHSLMSHPNTKFHQNTVTNLGQETWFTILKAIQHSLYETLWKKCNQTVKCLMCYLKTMFMPVWTSDCCSSVLFSDEESGSKSHVSLSLLR